MSRVMLFTTTALFGLAAAGMSYAGDQRPAASSAGARIVRHAPSNNGSSCGGLPVLYEQDTTSTGQADSGIGIVSQNFESSFNQYDAQAADDFKVPAGGWTISEVEVTGVYFNGPGPATSETVTFYENSPTNKPGAFINSFTVSGADSAGSFCIPISQALNPGHYWVSVVANMDFSAGGEWGWENLVPPKIHKWAHWRNPGFGFAVCKHWRKEKNCIPDGQGDHIFTLRGP